MNKEPFSLRGLFRTDIRTGTERQLSREEMLAEIESWQTGKKKERRSCQG